MDIIMDLGKESFDGRQKAERERERVRLAWLLCTGEVT